MATFDDIVKRCKASVHLDVNDHLAVYETLEQHLLADGMFPDLALTDRERILRAGVIYRLQFYPDTPIGFYVVYGTSLSDVVEQATSILDRL